MSPCLSAPYFTLQAPTQKCCSDLFAFSSLLSNPHLKIYLFYLSETMSTQPISLPSEVWRDVINHSNDNSSDLKNLLQVCRTFYALGVPLLFSTLQVSNGDPTYNFIRISTIPRLAQLVRRIQFVGAGVRLHLAKIDTRDNCLSGTLSCPLVDCGPRQSKEDIAHLLDRALQEQGALVAQECQRKILYWQQNCLADLVHLSLSNGRSLDLRVFRKLQSVETSNAIFLRGSFFSAIQDKMQQWLELKAANRNDDQSYNSCYRLHQWRSSALDIAATVVHVSLYRIQEILISDRCGDRILESIKHLKIDISASKWESRQEWKDCEGRHSIIAPWLAQISGLETLTVIQNPQLEPAIDIVRELRLPRSATIQQVMFKHLTTFGRHLLTFAHNRGGPLHGFSIIEPIMIEAEWEFVRAGLDEMRWCFGNFQLTDAYKPDGMTRFDWDHQWDRRNVVPFDWPLDVVPSSLPMMW